MPEGYTHIRTARRAAMTLRYPLRCPEAFAAGANGPDVFFPFEVWKPRGLRRFDLPALGSRMHREATGAFLVSLLRRAKTRAQAEYTLGFLSHYAADTALHPYVAALCQSGMPYDMPGGHSYFEIALDSALHAADTGRPLVPAQSSSPIPPTGERTELAVLLRAAIREVYGLEVPLACLEDAFVQLHQVRRLFPSRHGLRRGLFYLVETFFGGRGYLTGHVSPRALAPDLPDEWVNPATGQRRRADIQSLLLLAEQNSVLFFSAALRYWTGILPERGVAGLLGSRDYETGTETEASAPPHS